MSKSILFGILRWVAVALVVVLVASMLLENRVSDADPDAVWNAVTHELELSDLELADKQMLKRLYGLNSEDFEFCALYYHPSSFVGAEELLLVKLKDVAQQDMVRTAVLNRHETQKTKVDGYLPALFDMLTTHYAIEIRGNFVLFVVHSDYDAAVRAFADAL